MKSTPYKYRIHFYLRRLTYDDYIVSMRFLPSYLGITEKTFKAWIFRKVDESQEIPGAALLKLAHYFEVSPEELFEVSPYGEKGILKSKFIEFKKDFLFKTLTKQ